MYAAQLTCPEELHINNVFSKYLSFRSVSVKQIDSAYPVSHFLQSVEDPFHGVIVCIELNLSWAVKDDVIVSAGFQLFLEPFHVVRQILHAVDNAPVGTQLQILHCVLQRNQLQNRNVGRIWNNLIGRIEVNDSGLPTTRTRCCMLISSRSNSVHCENENNLETKRRLPFHAVEELIHSITVCRLA